MTFHYRNNVINFTGKYENSSSSMALFWTSIYTYIKEQRTVTIRYFSNSIKGLTEQRPE